MKMKFAPVPVLNRTLGVEFESDGEKWLYKDQDVTKVNLEFNQVEHTVTFTRALLHGASGDIANVGSGSDLPIWLNDLVAMSRTALTVKVTGRTDKVSPVFPTNWTDEKRLKYYKQYLENAVYDMIKGDMTREELEEHYQLDYTIEAKAAMRVSNQENWYLQADNDRMSLLIERLEEENRRLREVDEVCNQLSLIASEKFDATSDEGKGVKNEITKLGIRCYSRLRQISMLVNAKSANREVVVYTDELTQLLDGWNALGSRKVGSQ